MLHLWGCDNASDYRQLFLTYYSPVASLPMSSQNIPPSSFWQGMAAYKTGDYRTAKRHWLSALEKPGFNDTLQFYLGITYLEMGRTDSSIHYFNRVFVAPHSSYRKAASWYKALCQVKNQQSQAAIESLNTLIDRRSPYQLRAKELYKELTQVAP